MGSINFEKLDKLAKLSVSTGVALQKGQNLLITAPSDALPLVRLIAKHAYKAGAGLVTPFFSDSEITLARYKHASNESFDVAADWLYKGMGEAFDNNTARMAIAGDDPMLLSDMDPERVARANKANSKAYKPARERITQFDINWNIIAWPGLAWAKRMFPDLAEGDAQTRLAEAIFMASRVNAEDPVASWKTHNQTLKEKREWLNQKDFKEIHFKGPGTDLKVGLADDHEWMGGASMAQNGVICNPNIPSEEVFTTPHALRVEGYVSSTKPLSHQGTLIDNIRVVFEKGSITDAKASKGETVLKKVLESDEGARRLGEVALYLIAHPFQSQVFFL